MRIVVLTTAIFGVLATLTTGIVAVAAFYMVNSGVSSRTAESFAKTLSRQDVSGLQQLFHPGIMEDIDQPVMETWMVSLKNHYGPYRHLSANNFSSSWRYDSLGRVDQYEGEAVFEKGTVTLSLTERDRKIVEFEIETPKMDGQWFAAGPADNELYVQRATEFAEALGNQGGEIAYQLMCPELQDVVDRETMIESHKTFTSRVGQFLEISSSGCEYDSARCSLRVNLAVVAEKGTVEGFVRFELSGLKMKLAGFDIYEVSTQE